MKPLTLHVTTCLIFALGASIPNETHAQTPAEDARHKSLEVAEVEGIRIGMPGDEVIRRLKQAGYEIPKEPGRVSTAKLDTLLKIDPLGTEKARQGKPNWETLPRDFQNSRNDGPNGSRRIWVSLDEDVALGVSVVYRVQLILPEQMRKSLVMEAALEKYGTPTRGGGTMSIKYEEEPKKTNGLEHARELTVTCTGDQGVIELLDIKHHESLSSARDSKIKEGNLLKPFFRNQVIVT